MDRQRAGAASRAFTAPGAAQRLGRPRRGVSSVLAMMFLVIFGSLAAAMAVVAQGNLRTADSSLRVSRAMSAAETGLSFASRRLSQESKRFVTTRGVVDTTYANELWLGTFDTSEVTVGPPVGFIESTPPAGLMHAVRNAHLADSHDFNAVPGDSSLPSVDNTLGILLTKPIRVFPVAVDPDGAYFRLRYEVLLTEPYVRVTAQGIDGDITRTIQLDFRIDKKIEYAILSPNRIMIGKNVRVEGPLGSRYGVVPDELNNDNGDPLVMRSDFYYLSPALDTKLDTLYDQIALHDADGDGRLRPSHPAESIGIAAAPTVLVDADGNEYVDDFDLFLEHYDANSDGSVVYDSALAGGATDEFDDDEQLARLIDEATPDRDADGAFTASDNGLGYQDGKINSWDLYAKVSGRLRFAVAQADWELAHGDSYQTIVQGPVTPAVDETATGFDVGTDELGEITTAMLDSSSSWFDTQSQGGAAFGDTGSGQVSSQIAGGGTYTDSASGTWESVPYGSSGAYDYYQRPAYEDMTFTDVRIPKGTNGLFKNCTFIGVTFIETNTDCAHENWNYAGSLEPVEVPPGSGNWVYDPRFPDLEAQYGATVVTDTRTESNNIRFEDCTFLGSISGDKPDEYTHWRNKVQFTGTSRFYIDADDPEIDTQADAVAIRAVLNGMAAADIEEMKKSSILLPGWSVDVGNFDNAAPKIKLRGTIIAGILDARGTVDIFGTLLMTFRPTDTVGPLFYGGQTDAFNTTIGYFGPADGDGEGIDPSDPGFPGFGEISLRYDPNTLLPDGIPWPIRSDAVSLTYVEGGSL